VDALTEYSIAIQAVAALFLTSLTAAYVWLTSRIARRSLEGVELARTALEEARRHSVDEVATELYKYLGEQWYELLDVCLDYPQFMSVSLTERYHDRLTSLDAQRYDVYCYKLWGYVEDIVEKDHATNLQFRGIIAWAITHHFAWLEHNPTYFTSEEFWEAISVVRQEPQLTVRYEALPTKDGDIDWDGVSSDYHDQILGPFAPEMLEETDGPMRNLLVAELVSAPARDYLDLRVADFGCGPGNLFPHLAGRVSAITAVDKSAGALEIARRTATTHGIDLTAVHAKFADLNLDERFDLIVSVNSVLPSRREDVVPTLATIRRHLSANGRVLAVLPSYDTTQYLRGLWHQHYTKVAGSAHADRILRAAELSKKVNDEECLYADDGRTQQSYHTPETIVKEFAAAGLRLTREPAKLRYPWSLTRRFDYGYFPDAPEEIWDWYVVAEAVDVEG